MKDPYFDSYMSGRFDQYDGEINLDELVDRMMAGVTPIRDISIAAAKIAIATEMDPSVKVQWIRDNLDEITAMGGDTEKAYRLYMQGRIDGLSHQLEADIINSIDEQEDDGDDGDQDDEDDDDDDDDDDDEDEDEDEEVVVDLPPATLRKTKPRA